MMAAANPYDALPYLSLPIEWTAPERLALASMLHGGPRVDLADFSLLEIGCGNGANILPLAFYRAGGSFVGIDAAESQIQIATDRMAGLGLENLSLAAVDLIAADRFLEGQFDFIVAHGVFSWIPNPTRDALLELCRSRLSSNGLLYLNYNCLPGWSIRGLVREFLLAQTRPVSNLRDRAMAAKQVAAQMAQALDSNDHPYSKLMANEFQLAANSHVSYVGHEYLADDNHPYWRSDFRSLARRFGFKVIADADFNYPEQSIPADLESSLSELGISGRSKEDTLDLLCYRQIHSPILARESIDYEAPTADEFGSLEIASQLRPTDVHVQSGRMFEHPNGFKAEIDDADLERLLTLLYACWPSAKTLDSISSNISEIQDDLALLHRSGLIELRIAGVSDHRASAQLQDMEREWGGYVTTPNHVRESP